jgi:hypothetical protein
MFSRDFPAGAEQSDQKRCCRLLDAGHIVGVRFEIAALLAHERLLISAKAHEYVAALLSAVA